MNASLFKIVFSKRLGMLVAVGEHASSQGKARGNSSQPGTGASQGAGTFFLGVLGLCFGLTSMAWAQGVASTALPTGGAVSAGTAAISSVGAAMTIQQSSQRAAINWQSFNIGKDASVTVQQPNNSSVLLNRIGGDSPSQILGRMSANGQIVLVNPNGMTFGKDGSVSAAGFTASTLGISDADFMAGNMKFSRDGATGSILNQGSIQTSGGYVALLGASVSNEGKIETAGGNAYLAAAETVRVPVSGTGRIQLELSPASINAAVANRKEGAIVTQGGQVYMQAAALHTAMASVLQSGNIDTTGAQAGNVTLLAEGGNIQVDGRITANSTQPNQAGGRIVIGRDEDTGALAKSTNVSGATLQTQGGFIETSGEHLQVSGVKIQAKDWLLDPNDIVIDSTNPTSGSGLADAQTQNGISYINTADITAALNSANVTIATSASATGGNGDITVNSAIANNSTNKTLTLNATRDITLNAAYNSYSGGLQLTAGRDVNVNAAIYTPLASVGISAGQDLNFNSGASVTIAGGAAYSATLNATRDIYIRSNVSVNSWLNSSAGRDYYIYANLSNNFWSYSLYAGRDMQVNSAMSNQGTLGLYAARDLYINSDVTSTGAEVRLVGGNGTAWSSNAISGAISFANNARISYATGLSIVSGRSQTISSLTAANSANTWRTDFDDVNVIWSGAATAGAAPSVNLWGFNTVTLNNPNGSGATIRANSLNVQAKTINVGANLDTLNLELYGASFADASGSYYVAWNGAPNIGWTNNTGTVSIANGKSVAYTDNLRMMSGKTPGTNARSSLAAGSVLWSNTPGNGSYVILDGFDTVTIDRPVGANLIGVSAQQVNVQADINMSSLVRLYAASFDAGGSYNNFIGDAWGSNGSGWGVSTGWAYGNLQGTVDLGNHTVKGNSFDIRSGTVIGNSSLRLDFNGSQLQAYQAPGASTPSTVNNLYLAGYRDVTLPTSFSSIGNAGQYSVYARNIDGTGLANRTLNAYTLNLYAGAFADLPGIGNRATYSTANAGVLTLPASLGIQSSVVAVRSGINNAPGTIRTDWTPASFSPYVNPANPALYTGVYSSNGLLSGQRTGGARLLDAQGFNLISLPTAAYPLNYERVNLYGNTITINGDINAGQCNNCSLTLVAGNYNPTTGAVMAEGSQAGSVIFSNNPTLRMQAYTLTTSTDNSTKGYGYGSSIYIVNGTTAADFNAKLGYTQPDYSAGGSGVINSITLKNFNNTPLQMEAQGSNTSPTLKVLDQNGTGFVSVSGRTFTGPGDIAVFNDVQAQSSISLDAIDGGIRMGEHVLKATAVNVAATLDSAVNTDTDTLSLTSRGAGHTLVANEANNVNINASSADLGNIEVNARGEITLTSSLSRTGAGSGVTLHADAQYGRTVDVTDSTHTLVVNDLNSTFANYNVGTFGELGGDGYGTMRVSISQPTLLLPNFRSVAVVDGASFTVNAANTYFKPDGTAYANGTVLPQGTFVMLSGAIPTGLDTVTSSGTPYRLKATVGVGGWNVPAANTYYDASGTAYASGTHLNNGDVVYYRTTTALASGAITASGDNGTRPLYVVSGYSTSSSSSATPLYYSQGFGYSASYSPLPSASQSASSTRLSVDTAVVDTSLPGNYYGNPVSGTNNALNLSGQFYTFEPSNNWVRHEWQGAPTMLNGLATGKSASGNGWDISWGTAQLSTNGGTLKILSGPKHALSGSGYEAGDWSDFTLYTNPSYSDFTTSKLVYEGAARVSSGAGDLVVLGFRDVMVKDPNNLSSSGNVTIGAARDMVFLSDANFNSAIANPKLVTLVAGGMLTSKKADGSYATIGAPSGAGTSNLMVVAGGGVDLQVNVAAIGGSLQDNPNMATPPMSGGRSPTGVFNIQSSNPNGLVVGGSFTNNQINDFTFDGTAGIQYAPDTPLSRSGIRTFATAAQLAGGSAGAGYGAVNLTSAAGTSITLNQAIDTTGTGGNITVTAPVDILQNANIVAGAGDVTLTATTGAISRTAGTVGGNDVVLQAATTIGSASQAIQTSADTLKLVSASNQFVTEANDVTLAAQSGTGNITVGSTHGSITVGTVGTSSGISTTGSAKVLLTAAGVGSDIVLNQAITTGSGEINLKAADSVALGANVSTTGNDFIEATAGSITRSAGTVSGNQAVLTAGTSMGANGSAVQTSVSALAIQSGGDAFVQQSQSLAVSGQSTGGALHVDVSNGNVSVQSLNISPSVAGNASGYNSSGLSAATTLAVSASGSISQADASQLLSATDTVLSAGTTIGSGSQNMRTQTGSLKLTSAGDQFVTETNDLTLAASTRSNGHVNVQTTNGSITVGTASGLSGVSANGNGHVLLTANGSGSDIHVTQAITSGSGEINLKAADSVALGANVSTTGNDFIEATAGSITRSAGTVSGNQAVLTAGTSMGANGSAVQTSVNALGVTTGHDAFVADADSVSMSAQSSGTGTISLTANTGTLTVANLHIAPTLSGNASGYSLTGTAAVSGAGNVALSAANAGNAKGVVVADSVTAAGAVSVQATSTGQTAIDVTDNISAGSNLTLTGAASDGQAAIALQSGVALSNTGGITRLEATQGNISAPSSLAQRASITQGSGAGAVQIVAGNASTSAGSIDASRLDITQNNANGVLMQTTGTGNLVVANIANNGNGHVILSAGSALAAGDGSGGQVVAASGNAVTQSGSGKTQVYSGNVTDTSAISTVVNGFTDDLRMTDLDTTHLQNTRANADYGATITGSTQSTEVYFRERVNLDTTLSGAVTYGADLSGSAIRTVLANGNASNTIVKSSAAGTLKANGAAVAAMLDATTLGQSSSFSGNYSTSNKLKANPNTPYVLDTSLSDFTGVQATLLVNKKDATAIATATIKEYNGQTQNQDAATTSGFISGDQIVVSGASSGKNAGTYTSNLQVTGTDASNYNIAVTNRDLNIEKNTTANVVLTANSDAKVYNGSTQSVSGYTVTGLVGDDATHSAAATSGITAGASGTNAGTYTSTFSGSNADLANNYQNVSYVNGALTITKNTSANVVLTANSDAKQYNGTTQSVSGYTVTGLVGDDATHSAAATSGITAGASGTNAGTYASTFSGSNADLANNYQNVSYVNGALTITKNTTANVVLTANSDSKQYSGTTQSVSGYTVTGLVGDDATHSAAATSGISAGASGKNAGTYTSSFSGSNTDLTNNYANVSFVSGALDITRNTTANVVLTANSDAKVYNGSTQSISGFSTQGTLAVDDTAAVSAGASGKNAGTYATSFSGTDQLEANYAHVQKVNGALTIAPKEVSLQASKVYDNSRNLTGQQLTISTGIANETLNYSAASLASKDVADNATNHVASVTLTDGSGLASNYTFNPIKGANNQALITPAPLTIAATATQTVYNGKLQQQALPTVQGLLGNDAITVSGLATGTDPGSYMSSLRWSGLGADNYAVTALNAPLVILNALALLPSFNRESVKQIDPITRITLLGFRSASTGGATAVLQKLQLATSAQTDSCSATSLELCECQSEDDAQAPLFCKPTQP